MFLEHYGLILGLLLLALVSAVALWLGRQAARQVSRFRDQHHQRFRGRANP